MSENKRHDKARRTLVTFWPIIWITGAVACSDGSGPGLPVPGPPVSAVIIRGGDQRDTVGKTLPDTLIISVRDSANVPVNSAVISWIGDGEPFVSASATNASGQARNVWKLGTQSGSYRLEARSLDPTMGTARVLAVFNATGIPGSATQLNPGGAASVFVGGTRALAQIAGARDRYGNPTAAGVTFTSNTPGLIIRGDSASLDREGTAEISVSAAGITRTIRLSAFHDLRMTRWAVDYSCWDGEITPDSIAIRVQTDSVTYNTLPGNAQNSVLYFHMRGTANLGRSSPPRDTAFAVYSLQFADSIEATPLRSDLPPNRKFFSNKQTPPTYSGGRWCRQAYVNAIPVVIRPVQ